MPNPETLPLTSQTHPFLSLDSSAEKKRQLLLKLAANEPDKNIRAVFKAAAEKLRRLIHGYTEKEIRAEIKSLLDEYFCLKIDDFCELSEIPKADFKRILAKMEKEKIIEDVKFRRQHEAGKHLVPMYELKNNGKW